MSESYLSHDDLRQHLLANPTAGYQPASTLAMVGLASASLDGKPLFTWLDVPRMVRDPQVRLVERMWRAPFRLVTWKVRAEDPRVARFVDATLRRFWTRSLPKMLSHFFRWGFTPGGAEFKAHRGRIRLDRVRAVEPTEATPRVWKGGSRDKQFAGFYAGNLKVLVPHAMWFAGNGELGPYHDFPPLAGMFNPWLEKNSRNGAIDQRVLNARKNASRGDVVRFPDEYIQLGSKESPRKVHASDLARQIANTLETGSTCIMSSERWPQSDKYKWELQAPQATAQGVGQFFLDLVSQLDREMTRGAQIPDEVLEAAKTGSGWSGRTVPLMQFFGGVDETAGGIIEAADAWLKYAVAANYSRDAWYEVEPDSLVQKILDDGQGQGQGGDQGGGQGPPTPGQVIGAEPPPPTGQSAGGGMGARKRVTGGWQGYTGKRGGHWERNARTGATRHAHLSDGRGGSDGGGGFGSPIPAEIRRRVRKLLRERDRQQATELADGRGGAHAPHGGVNINGIFFRGGEFIPAQAMARATPAVRAKIEAGSPKPSPSPSAGKPPSKPPTATTTAAPPSPDPGPQQGQRPAPPANQAEILSRVQRAYHDADMNDPMGHGTYVGIYDRMDQAGVPHQVRSQFDGHGTSLQGLAHILNHGIDPNRQFYSERLDSSPAARLLRDTPGNVLALGHPGKTISEGGVGGVVVPDHYAPHVQHLEHAFPGVKFVPASKAAAVLKKVATPGGPPVEYARQQPRSLSDGRGEKSSFDPHKLILGLMLRVQHRFSSRGNPDGAAPYLHHLADLAGDPDRLRDVLAGSVSMSFNPSEPRDEGGQWTSGGGGKKPAPHKPIELAVPDHASAFARKGRVAARRGDANAVGRLSDLAVDRVKQAYQREWKHIQEAVRAKYGAAVADDTDMEHVKRSLTNGYRKSLSVLSEMHGQLENRMKVKAGQKIPHDFFDEEIEELKRHQGEAIDSAMNVLAFIIGRHKGTTLSDGRADGTSIRATLLSWEPYIGKRGTGKGVQVGWQNFETGRVVYTHGAAPGEKRAKQRASAAKARELSTLVMNGEATADHLKELADHLPVMTVDDLRNARIRMGLSLGSRRKRAEMEKQVLEHVQGLMAEERANPGAMKARRERESADLDQPRPKKPRATTPADISPHGRPALTADGKPADPRPDGTPKYAAPGTVYKVPTGSLKVDPERFQYKLGTNKRGVTDQFKDTRVYNPALAGVTTVWRDPDTGQDHVVNGHHRHELAERTGHPDMNVMYSDAQTVEEARAQGALANIAEGRGTAVGAAKFFRDTRLAPADAEAKGVNLRENIARDANTLLHLSDANFSKLARGQIELPAALAVARHVTDPDRQDKLFKKIQEREDEGKGTTQRHMEEMARQMAAVPSTSTTTSTLWGDETNDEDVFDERAELAAAARADLAREANDFAAGSSERRAEKLGEHGNVLDVAANQRLKDQADRAKNLYDLLVYRKGPISDALNTGAIALKKAKTRKEKEDARSHTSAAVRAAIAGEFGRLDTKQPAGESVGAVAGAEGAGADGRGPTDSDGAAVPGGTGEVKPAVEEEPRSPPPEPAAPEHAGAADPFSASTADHTAAITSIPPGELGWVAGHQVRNVGGGKFQVETLKSFKTGTAAEISQHVNDSWRHAATERSAIDKAIARAGSFQEPDWFGGGTAAQEVARRRAAVPAGARGVSLEPHSRGRPGIVQRDEGGAAHLVLDGTTEQKAGDFEPLESGFSWRVPEKERVKAERPKQGDLLGEPAKPVVANPAPKATGHPGLDAALHEYRQLPPDSLAARALAAGMANAGYDPEEVGAKSLAKPDTKAEPRAEVHRDRDVAGRLVSAWLEAHKLGKGDPAHTAPLERAMHAAGVRRIGTPGETVPFAGEWHERGAGEPAVNTGTPVRVVRPGWVMDEPDGGVHRLMPAKVVPLKAGEHP